MPGTSHSLGFSTVSRGQNPGTVLIHQTGQVFPNRPGEHPVIQFIENRLPFCFIDPSITDQVGSEQTEAVVVPANLDSSVTRRIKVKFGMGFPKSRPLGSTLATRDSITGEGCPVSSHDTAQFLPLFTILFREQQLISRVIMRKAIEDKRNFQPVSRSQELFQVGRAKNDHRHPSQIGRCRQLRARRRPSGKPARSRNEFARSD